MSLRHGGYAATLLASLAGLTSTSALAQDLTGTIDVSLELTEACSVNGSTETTGLDFGALDFGTQTTLFEQVDSEVQSGGGSIEVLCSPGTEPAVAVTGGANDAESGSATHAMTNGTSFVPYSLYTDAGRTTELGLNNPTALAGEPDGVNPQTLDLYGRAFGQEGLTPGTYSDTLNVVLTF
ncbi:Csu type fimbrial protein [Salinicola rhizosphaerae]|uniref:Protein CsuA n=1 Tax=Salinicola rhizosphaerae TaxID=1443141 RepID=A0ABQ3DRM9_9GAMM|nr:spore coat U domain-containing protein [Salinicola rhizosphaerae]GHB13310.1 protein CsuA [Salinicola rhizosphaerae]